MSRPREERLSIEPLLNTLLVNDIEAETMLDPRHYAAIRKAKMKGHLTLTMADEIACKVLKMHPFEIWGAEYETNVWHDMHDQEEATIIALPVPVSPVYMAVAA